MADYYCEDCDVWNKTGQCHQCSKTTPELCALCAESHPGIGNADAKCKACRCPDEHKRHTCGLRSVQTLLRF